MDQAAASRNLVRRTIAGEVLSRAARPLARTGISLTRRVAPSADPVAALTPDGLTVSGDVAAKTFNVATKTDDVEALTPMVATQTFNVAGKTFNVATITFNVARITFDVARKTFDVARKTFDVADKTFEVLGPKNSGKRLIFSNLRANPPAPGKICRFHRSAGVPPPANHPARRRANPQARTPAPHPTTPSQPPRPLGVRRHVAAFRLVRHVSQFHSADVSAHSKFPSAICHLLTPSFFL